MIRFQEFMEDMGLDSKEDIKDLYQEFISEMTELIASLEDFQSYADSSQIQKIIHNIKGVSANLYVDTLNMIAKEYEDFIIDELQSNTTLSYDEHYQFIHLLNESLTPIHLEINQFFNIST